MNEDSLMRSDLNDDYGLTKLQGAILSIARDIDRLCRDEEIDYCLMGGSALGAKRHGGFIPWDDDLDLFMTPQNYAKFRAAFQARADRKYYLQEWGTTDGEMIRFSKVRLNNSTYVEESFKNWDMHQGIYVDIFILHNCSNHKIGQLWQCLWSKYVIMKGLAIRRYNRRGGFIGATLKLMRLTPKKFLMKFALKQVYRYQNKKTKYFCNFLGKAVFKNAIYKREFFEKTVYVPFETIELKAPALLHEFLSDRFGDYMTPPSPERIKWEQHAEIWDTEKDFREYLTCIRDYSDEWKLI